MKIGIVGKPNVGKSSFFKASTLTEVEIADYPFTTIKANVGIGYVKVKCACQNFGVKCSPVHGFCLRGFRFVPVELIDVAGLVPGAHEGKGLGNKFLDDLRQADLLVHVIDASGSTDEKGERVEKGSHDPLLDVKFLERELGMWVFQILKRQWHKTKRNEKAEKILAEMLSGLKVREGEIEKVLEEMQFDKKLWCWREAEIQRFALNLLRESKPVLIAANKCDLVEKSEMEELKKRVEKTGYPLVPCSAVAEIALKSAAKNGLISYIPGEKNFEILRELSPEQEKALEYIRKNVLEKFGTTGVQDVLDKAVFEILNYIAVFPVGEKLSDAKGNVLPDCFLLPSGSTALDLAYRIHEDFGKNFIRAIDVKNKKIVGRDYVLRHGDVIQIIAGT